MCPLMLQDLLRASLLSWCTVTQAAHLGPRQLQARTSVFEIQSWDKTYQGSFYYLPSFSRSLSFYCKSHLHLGWGIDLQRSPASHLKKAMPQPESFCGITQYLWYWNLQAWKTTHSQGSNEQQTSPGQDLSQASFRLQSRTRRRFPRCAQASPRSRVLTAEPLRPGLSEEQRQAELCDTTGHLSK